MERTTAFIERLGLKVPIVQAPMASISTAELVAAVSGAGALGSLGSAVMSPETVVSEVEAIRAQTDRPFSLNFFVHSPPRLDRGVTDRMRARLARYQEELTASDADLSAAPPPFAETILERVLALRPAAVSFHFGLPRPEAITELHRAGIFVIGTATHVVEAQLLEQAGFDAVIAQGFEAGGHRGTFAVPYPQGETGLIALLPKIVDAVRVPVIAAGGIADGRAIAAALVLGAAAVQLGTVFLGTRESAIDPIYRRTLADPRASSTRVTSMLSGRPARAIATRFTEEMAAEPAEPLEFPLQRLLTWPLSAASVAAGNPEFHAMWAGQAAPIARALPAADLVNTLVEETERAFAAIGRGLNAAATTAPVH